MRFLILRLEGPLMAFGDVAVDEIRPTALLPGASMLAGLAANALGFDATEYARLQNLQDRLVHGSRLDAPGALLRDFQTARLSRENKAFKRPGKAPGEQSVQNFDAPFIREKYFLADARVTVVLALVPPRDEPRLEDLARAFLAPERPLFLGRMACPPSAFLFRGESIDAENPEQALRQVPRLVLHSDEAPVRCLCEWPAELGENQAWSMARGEGQRLVERRDLRNWRDDLHEGSRFIFQGDATPPVTRIPFPGAAPEALDKGDATWPST